MNNPFANSNLRDWFILSEVGIAADAPEVVSTTGSGPFEEDEFDEFLRECGTEIPVVSPATEVLVVGKDGWSEALLATLIRWRVGKSLRVYSQEMFLCHLSGADPFKAPPGILSSFAEDHPALLFLEDFGFDY